MADLTKASLGEFLDLNPRFLDYETNPAASAMVRAAARFVERLLPETCSNCFGSWGGGPIICKLCGDNSGQLWDEGLVEVVAKALYSFDAIAHGFDPSDWSQEFVEVRREYRGRARAALAALANEVGK